jgi:hypothetical protein
MKQKIIILTVLMFSFSASAQLADQAEIANVNNNTGIGLNPASSPFSLIDLSRVKWSHSYSVSFFSGGSNSSSLGLWNTSMFYEFSKNLSLTLNLGVAHDANALFGGESSFSKILPGFLLDYHPSNNFNLRVGFQSYSGYYPYYYNYLYDNRFR